jgi:hypothetical protein
MLKPKPFCVGAVASNLPAIDELHRIQRLLRCLMYALPDDDQGLSCLGELVNTIEDAMFGLEQYLSAVDRVNLGRNTDTDQPPHPAPLPSPRQTVKG